MADQTATLSSEYIEVLPAETVRQTGFTHKFTIPYTVINTSTWTTQGDTVTVTLGTTPTKHVVKSAVADITTAFATTGTLTLQVGTSTDQDNYIDAQTAKTAAALIGAAGGAPVTEAGTVGIAAQTLVARFTTQAATGAPSDITAGSVTILIGMANLAI